MDIRIQLARDDAMRARCWRVLQQLRPQLDELRFLAQARRQTAQVGWQLLYAEQDNDVAGCAGFRIGEWLA